MRKIISVLILGSILFFAVSATGAGVPISDATAECIDCHSSIHPGIVKDWQDSRHAKTTPNDAMAVNGPARKVSSKTVPEAVRNFAVGCAECHMQRPKAHADTFEHNGYDIHVVVSPNDCSLCHVEEAEQYSKNLMSHAYKNLAQNQLYQLHQRTIIGETDTQTRRKSALPANADTQAEACYYCHGTQLKVTGFEIRDVEDVGELEFPVIEGWPNQGVGRINLDGSRGACTACHTRHAFSIEMARKPYTCQECHVGPDVPAYKVYAASKHGNIFAAMHKTWDFNAVPWTIGKDFSAPTCASCHISLLTNPDDEVVTARTHQMNNRLPWRIFGLIYAHPHPQNPDTTIIRNKDGLPLPAPASPVSPIHPYNSPWPPSPPCPPSPPKLPPVPRTPGQPPRGLTQFEHVKVLSSHPGTPRLPATPAEPFDPFTPSAPFAPGPALIAQLLNVIPSQLDKNTP